MRKNSMGLITLIGVGAFYAWRNRFQIQKFLESVGVNTPLLQGSFTDTIRSGVARIRGQGEHELGGLNRSLDRGVDNLDEATKRAI